MYKKIIYYSVVILLISVIIYLLFKPKDVEIKYIIKSNGVDTIYYKNKKDSIIYNIKQQDSIIYVIKQKMKYEIKEVSNYNDSTAIELFNELSSE